MKTRYCTALSNASLEYFSRNTLSTFTNFLPFPIYPKQSHKLYVRLRAVAISTELRTDVVYDATRCHFIKIKLGELEPQISGSGFEPTLATLQFPPEDVRDEYGLYNFENKPFLALESSPLQRLSLHIVDSSGNTLPLAPGPPTIVKLEITDNMDTYNQFTVTLESTQSKDLYPENKMHDFKVQLPSEMNFSGWEVGLQSVSFPSDFVVKHKYCWMEVDLVGEWTGPIRIGVRLGLNEHADLTHYFRKGINENDILNKLIILEDDPNSEYQRIRALDGNGEKRVRISYDGLFRRAMGHDVITSDSYIIKAGESAPINTVVNTALLKSSPIAFVYSNCIEENIVGSGMFQLLQIIPVKKKTTDWDFAMYEPQHILFHPVKSQQMTNISLRFTQPDGVDHAFKSDSEQPLIVTLVFRPSNQPSAPPVVQTVSRNPGEPQCSLLTGTCKQ
jgi:hypothetical protein